MGTSDAKPQEPNTAKSVESVSPSPRPENVSTGVDPSKHHGQESAATPPPPTKSHEDILKDELNLRVKQLNELDDKKKKELSSLTSSHKNEIESLANDRDNLKEELLHLKRAFDRIEVDHYARLERIKEVFKTSGMDTMQQAKVFNELKNILEW